jgi:hypothetical protein
MKPVIGMACLSLASAALLSGCSVPGISSSPAHVPGMGLYYSTLERCAGKPATIAANYPAQRWQYPGCEVVLDGNYVAKISGTCEVLRQCE